MKNKLCSMSREALNARSHIIPTWLEEEREEMMTLILLIPQWLNDECMMGLIRRPPLQNPKHTRYFLPTGHFFPQFIASREIKRVLRHKYEGTTLPLMFHCCNVAWLIEGKAHFHNKKDQKNKKEKTLLKFLT